MPEVQQKLKTYKGEEGTNTSYPDHEIDPRSKNDAWILQYCEAAFSERISKNATLTSNEKQRYIINRKYAEGMQDVNKYKKLLDCDSKDKSYMNINWSPVAILPKFLNIILGRMEKEQSVIELEAIDPLAKKLKREMKHKAEAKMTLRDWMKQLDAIAGKTLESDKELQEIPESLEELELKSQIGYKLDAEMTFEEFTHFIMYLNEWNEVAKETRRDIATCGKGATKTYLDKNGFLRVRRCDVINLETSYSNRSDFRRIRHAFEIIPMTFPELKQMAGDQFSRSEYSHIKTLHTNPANNESTSAYGNQYGANEFGYSYNDKTISVMDIEFRSVNTMVHEKRYNSHGGFKITEKEYDYKVPSRSRNKVEEIRNDFEVIYKAKWIVGTNYLFDAELATDMEREKDNLADVRMTFAIHAPDLLEMNNKSITEKLATFEDAINIAWFKIQNAVAKARPKGLMIEIGGLEGVANGEGGEFTPLQLLAAYDQTGNMLYRRTSDEGLDVNYRPVEELQNGLGIEVEQYWAQINHCVEMMRQVSGLNEAADASTPSPDALVGTSKLAMMQSENAIQNIVSSWDNIHTNTAKNITHFCQVLLEDPNKRTLYEEAMGDFKMETVIDITTDKPLHVFGIKTIKRHDLREREILEANIQQQLALRTQSGQGGIELEDATMIRRIDNIKFAEQMLILRKKKRAREDERRAAEAQDRTAKIQQESAMAAEKAKRETLQFESQLRIKEKQELAKVEMSIKKFEADLEYRQTALEKGITIDIDNNKSKNKQEEDTNKILLEASVDNNYAGNVA